MPSSSNLTSYDFFFKASMLRRVASACALGATVDMMLEGEKEINIIINHSIWFPVEIW